MRKWFAVTIIIVSILSFISVVPAFATTLINQHTGVATNTTTGQVTETGDSGATTSAVTSSLPAAELNSTTGKDIFDPSKNKLPFISNYVFDSDGWQGNFDPLYWIANFIFSVTVGMMFASLEFFSMGYSATGINGITNIALKILHASYGSLLGPVLPLVIFAFIGVFLWFGVIKHDVHAIAGRGIKTVAVLLLFAFLSNTSVSTANLINGIGDFPGQMGTYFGNVVNVVVSTATGKQATSTPDLISSAWMTSVIPEWVAGEEGQNYVYTDKTLTTLKIGPLDDGLSAWRYILKYPLQNGTRNGVVGLLQATPDGPLAFASPNRLDVSIMSFFGNLGQIMYFLVMGAIMLFARITFVVLVAAGAIILPMELFPVTRATTLTLKWFQYMAMSLFVIFFVSIYSSILFGLMELITQALSGTAFAAPKIGSAMAESTATGLVASFPFLGQGLGYLVAILVAWWIYKKMKPMQKIKTITENAAKRGISIGGGQRLTAEEKLKNRSLLLRGRNNIKRRTMADRVQDAADAVKEASILGASDAVLRHKGDHRDFTDNDVSDNDPPGSPPSDEDKGEWSPIPQQEFSKWEFEPENGEHRLSWEEQNRLVGNRNGGTSQLLPPRSPVIGGNHSHAGAGIEEDQTESVASEQLDPFFGVHDHSNPYDGQEQSNQTETTAGQKPSNDEMPEWMSYRGGAGQERPMSAVAAPFSFSPSPGGGDNGDIGDKEKKKSELRRVNIDKVASGAQKAVKMISTMKVLASPDRAVDTAMEATLGFAAGKVTSKGKSVAFHMIRKIAAARAEADYAPRMPKVVKKQTKPTTGKARKRINITEPDQSYVNAYYEALNNLPKSKKDETVSSENKPKQLTPTAPKTDGITEKNTGPSSTPNTRERKNNDVPIPPVGSAPSVSVKLNLRQAVHSNPIPALRLKNATVSQIRSAQRRSEENRIKRLAKYTQSTLPKNHKPIRPNLRKKNGSSMSERIFGDHR